MITAYKYKPRSNKVPASQIDRWLELLCRQYNYRLAERFNWYAFTNGLVNYCFLVLCSIAPIVEPPDYYWLKKDLLNTKKLFLSIKNPPSGLVKLC
jgi:putative transposase